MTDEDYRIFQLFQRIFGKPTCLTQITYIFFVCYHSVIIKKYVPFSLLRNDPLGCFNQITSDDIYKSRLQRKDAYTMLIIIIINNNFAAGNASQFIFMYVRLFGLDLNKK